MGSFVTQAVFQDTVCVIELVINGQPYDEQSLATKRLTLADGFFKVMVQLSYIATALTIMLKFIKSGQKVSLAKRKQISVEYLFVFSSSKELEQINEERLQEYENECLRESALRRQEEYGELADRQISEVLKELISVSDVG